MSKVVGTPPGEELIPNRIEIPLRFVPPLLWVSIALFLAFVALGVYSQSSHETSRNFALLAKWERGYVGIFTIRGIGGTFEAIMGSVPILSALVMLWVSFLSPGWSDRMLWSAAMIFTANELSFDATYFFAHKEAGEVFRSYPRVSAVVGLVAYASWLLIIPSSTLPVSAKRVLSAICALAVLTIVAYPAIDAYTRTADTIGAVLFAGTLFTLGIFVASRVGVNLLRRSGVGGNT